MNQSTFPHTQEALSTCTSVRVAHILALASPNDELRTQAATKRDELIKLASASAVSADLVAMGSRWRSVIRDAESRPEMMELRKAHCSSTDASIRRKACEQRIQCFEENAFVMRDMRVVATREARERGFLSWIEYRTHALGGGAEVRKKLIDYITLLQSSVTIEQQRMRQALLLHDNEPLHWEDRNYARTLLLSQVASSALPVASDSDEKCTHNNESWVDVLYAWLNELNCVWQRVFDTKIHIDSINYYAHGVGAWSVPLVSMIVSHGGDYGEIWIDALARPSKPFAGVTARIYTFYTFSSTNHPGAALVSLPFAENASTWGVAERTTFAHEMGHGLHQCLARVDKDDLPFCEVPSTLSEHAFSLSSLINQDDPFTALSGVYDACVALWSLDAFDDQQTYPRLSCFLRTYLPGWRIPEDAGEYSIAAIASKLSDYFCYVYSDLSVRAAMSLVYTKTPETVTRTAEQARLLCELWKYMTFDVAPAF
jgi:hypothetical protein